MERLKIICVCLFALLSINSYAQKQQFKKANKAYKSKNYAQAIPLFEEGLAIKDNLGYKTKLANCYRNTNQMDRAEQLYKEIVREPKAKPITYFYFGETLMSNEKYNEAKYWFQQYNYKVPDDERGPLMIAACANIKDIRPTFPNAGVLAFSQNSDGDDTAPIFHNGGIVYSSDKKQGIKLLKQKSGWTGRDFINLYFSKEEEGFRYTKPKGFSGKLNALNKNTANITFSKDGNRCVFTRNSNVANRKDMFTMQLFEAESNGSNKWKNVEEIPFCNVAYNYMHPALSPDGNQLYFVSDKGGGQGGTDIYVAKRKKNGNWGRPVNLGPVVNTSSNEGFPYIHHDGRLYFCSKGHVGYGGFDVFYVDPALDTEGWNAPINVGKPVNSPHDDISIYLTEDEERGMFTSAREGGDDDIYLFWKNGLPDGIQSEVESASTQENEIVSTPTPPSVTPTPEPESVPEPITEKVNAPKTETIPSVADLKAASENTVKKNEIVKDISQQRNKIPTESKPKLNEEVNAPVSIPEAYSKTPNTRQKLEPVTSQPNVSTTNSNIPDKKVVSTPQPASTKMAKSSEVITETPRVNKKLSITPSAVSSDGGMKPSVPNQKIASEPIQKREEKVTTLNPSAATMTKEITTPNSTSVIAEPTAVATEKVPTNPTIESTNISTNPSEAPVVNEVKSTMEEPVPSKENFENNTTIIPSTSNITPTSIPTNKINEVEPPSIPSMNETKVINEAVPRETIPNNNMTSASSNNNSTSVIDDKKEFVTASIDKVIPSKNETTETLSEKTVSTSNATKSTPAPKRRSRIVSTESLLVRKKYGETLVNDALPTNPRADAPQNLRSARRATNSNVKFSQLLRDLKRSRPMSGKYYRLDAIKYDIGSHIVTAEIASEINKLVDVLKRYPNMKIELGSHTYSIGSDENNLNISNQRVEAISQYLSQQGVDLSRVTTVGYGEQYILNHCSNGVVCTQEEHAMNERIEVKVLDQNP